MIKNVILAGGLIAILIIAPYTFRIGPTNIQLTKGPNLVNAHVTTLNQTGKAEPYATVDINGEPATVDKNGNFYKVINLKNGTNIINVTAKAPFKTSTKTYAVVNRNEDKKGVNWDWEWNYTTQTP